MTECPRCRILALALDADAAHRHADTLLPEDVAVLEAIGTLADAPHRHRDPRPRKSEVKSERTS